MDQRKDPSHDLSAGYLIDGTSSGNFSGFKYGSSIFILLS